MKSISLFCIVASPRSTLRRLCLLLLLASSAVAPSGAQTRAISGRVCDAASREPLPSATIRLAGSSRGTLTNARGEFQLPIYQTPGILVVSYVGYRSDSLDLSTVDSSRPLTVLLQPVSIQLPGVTVTDEDPAYEIIRRAIDEKKKWMAGLQRFEGRAFTRMVLRNDTSIASIAESYSTLYWSQHDTLREVVTQTRKTGNLPSAFRASSVGNVMNFNDDEIRQLGFRFVGPTSPSAFDYYDYKLLKTRIKDDYEVYDIQLLPRSRSTPLFYGRISIAEKSYAVIEVDVRPNEALVIPFVHLKGLRYRQHFGLYEDRYWLPADYRTEVNLSIALAGLKMPTFGIAKDVVIYDYTINPVFADSIRLMKSVTIDSSSTHFDSTFWAQTNVLPLTSEEHTAYQMLDSTQTLDKKFKPTGATASLATLAASAAFTIPEISFNRVEGFHVGAGDEFSGVAHLADVRAGLGYGFSDRVWKYRAGLTVPFGKNLGSVSAAGLFQESRPVNMFSIGADVYRELGHLPEEMPFSFLSNSISALTSKIDYYDYYSAEGWKTEFTYQPAGMLKTGIEFRSESDRSVRQNTDYSFFNRSRQFRAQPMIDDGQLRALTLTLAYGRQLFMNFTPQALLVNAAVEHADPDLLAGDFSYTRYKFSVEAKIRTMGSDLLFPQSLYIKVSAGASHGSLPHQRSFDILSGLGGYGQVGTFRGLKPREFYGDWFYSANLEQNFRRAPFLWLGIKPLYTTNWELIVTGSVARTPNSEGLYSEAGVGINNIFDLLRIDITYRFAAARGFIFSIGLADLFSGLL